MEAIKEQLEKWVTDQFGEEGLYLVDIQATPDHQYKIFMDSDTGITIDQCVAANRYLRFMMESEFPEIDASLEVSSPGLDRPLQLHRQYRKNVGRNLSVQTKSGTTLKGRLVLVDDEQIMLQPKISGKPGKIKKSEKNQEPVTVRFDEIEEAKVRVSV